MSAVLELVNINKAIEQEGRKQAILRDVSLKAAQGQITAIVGKSGSGKTTLLAVASGIDAPDSGSVKLLGKDFYRMKAAEQERFRNHNVGLLFQNYHLIPELTCEENIRMPLCFSDRGVDEKKLNEWIRGVGLEEKRNLYPRQMSGGEQQRAAILRAVVNGPQIIFADEPTGALDSGTGKQVISFLIDLSHRAGKAILLVTHDMDIARRCDRVIEMEDGRIKRNK